MKFTHWMVFAIVVNAFPFLDKILPDSLAPWRKLVNEVEKESSLFSELFDVGMEKGRKGETKLFAIRMSCFPLLRPCSSLARSLI
jgi:hypothetical protein